MDGLLSGSTGHRTRDPRGQGAPGTGPLFVKGNFIGDFAHQSVFPGVGDF